MYVFSVSNACCLFRPCDLSTMNIRIQFAVEKSVHYDVQLTWPSRQCVYVTLFSNLPISFFFNAIIEDFSQFNLFYYNNIIFSTQYLALYLVRHWQYTEVILLSNSVEDICEKYFKNFMNSITSCIWMIGYYCRFSKHLIQIFHCLLRMKLREGSQTYATSKFCSHFLFLSKFHSN